MQFRPIPDLDDLLRVGVPVAGVPLPSHLRQLLLPDEPGDRRRPPEQVLEACFSGERVPLEIEEQVPGIRLRQARQAAILAKR